MFKHLKPEVRDGFHLTVGSIGSQTFHQTFEDCSLYLDRLLYCLDDPCLDPNNGPESSNDFLIVIGVHPTHVYYCKNCQIILPWKLYNYIKKGLFLKPPNKGRLDPNFESKEAMVLSLIYVIFKLFGICFYRRISAEYLFLQYRSDSIFREALCAFVLFSVQTLKQNHHEWTPNICKFGDVIRYQRADLSPFGMAANTLTRFLHMFSVHSRKIRGIKVSSEIAKRIHNVERLSAFFGNYRVDGPEARWLDGYFLGNLKTLARWQRITRNHLGKMLDFWIDSVCGLPSLFRTGHPYLLDDPYRWQREALLRAVECQWKPCCKENRYHKNNSNGKFKKCGHCKVARYCSVRCQKLDWNRGDHKQICFHLTRSMKDCD